MWWIDEESVLSWRTEEKNMNQEVKGPENNPSIDDEIGREMKEAQIRELKKEYDHFTKTLKEKETALTFARRTYEVDLAGYEIALGGDNYYKVNPEFRYEQLDEYWVVRKKQLELQKDMFINKTEKLITDLELHVKQIKEQLESSSNKIKEMGGSVE